MKNFCTISLLALCLTAAGFAQQEISPDRFEGNASKQPVKTKQVVQKNHVSAAKRHVSGKSAKKTTLSARALGGN